MQTFLIWPLIASLLYWPSEIRVRIGSGNSGFARTGLILVLALVSFTAFKPEPKQSIYLSEQGRNELWTEYDLCRAEWPKGTTDMYIKGPYGEVHVLACGNPENPPVVMVHAASMGAHSWKENLEPLLDHYRIYSIDNIGEGNKSQLDDPLVYPNSQEEIADHLALIMDSLQVKKAILMGSSNGGYVSLCFADRYPRRVESLMLFGPMGLTQLTGNSIMMLSIASMYPFRFVKDWVSRWALGKSENVHRAYGSWFEAILSHTVPSVAMPEPMSTGQKQNFGFPVLLVLGSEDPIVGDAIVAKKTAAEIPGIRTVILESGHIVAVEQAQEVNNLISEFLGE